MPLLRSATLKVMSKPRGRPKRAPPITLAELGALCVLAAKKERYSAINGATTLISFTKILSDGPAVSLS
jgi:hypothetical protein